MIELIFILIILEIVVGIWSLVRINNFTKQISEANKEIETSGFTGSLSDLKNSLAKFNKQLKHLLAQQMQESEMNKIKKVINAIALSLPFIDLIIKVFSEKKNKRRS